MGRRFRCKPSQPLNAAVCSWREALAAFPTGANPARLLRSPIAILEHTVANMDDADRPAVVIAWVECKSCGRIEKAAQDFNLPDDVASDMDCGCGFPANGAGGTPNCTSAGS
jgi:hypothetical protein